MARISKVTLVLAALLGVALAGHGSSYIHVVHEDGHGGYAAPAYSSGHEESYHAASPYAYKYGVHDAHTGDVKSASESSHGGVVKGEYSLVQPDGVTRTVHYTADPHSGFNAHVTLSGHAHHAGQY